jgi:hypothetical protein
MSSKANALTIFSHLSLQFEMILNSSKHFFCFFLGFFENFQGWSLAFPYMKMNVTWWHLRNAALNEVQIDTIAP